MCVCMCTPQKKSHALHSLESCRKMYKQRKRPRKTHQFGNCGCLQRVGLWETRMDFPISPL